MRVFRSLLSPFLFILIFISLSCFLPPQVKAETNKQNLTAVSGPKVGEVTLYWQHADSADDYHLVYGREKDKFEYGALNIGRIESFTVKLLSPGTTYYFALVPLFGGRPLYTTGEVKASAKMPVKVVEVVEVKKEDLIQPKPRISISPTTQKKAEVEAPPGTKNELEKEETPEVYYQERSRSGGTFGARETKPVCQRVGSTLEGWYWLATKEGSENDLIRKDKCEGCYAFCKGIDSSSDGWYSSCDGRLIVRASCKSPKL